MNGVAEPAERDHTPSRSAVRDELARASLAPLAPGERPRAVTVAAIAALAFAIANLAVWIAGDDFGKGGAATTQMFLLTVILLAAAGGMWRARYWAVLGFETLLALQIIVIALALTRVNAIWGAVILLALIGAAGTLFWYLVRAMARIQMPSRPGDTQPEPPGDTQPDPPDDV